MDGVYLGREGSRVPDEWVIVFTGDPRLHRADYHTHAGSGAVEEGPATGTRLEASEGERSATPTLLFWVA